MKLIAKKDLRSISGGEVTFAMDGNKIIVVLESFVDAVTFNGFDLTYNSCSFQGNILSNESLSSSQGAVIGNYQVKKNIYNHGGYTYTFTPIN